MRDTLHICARAARGYSRPGGVLSIHVRELLSRCGVHVFARRALDRARVPAKHRRELLRSKFVAAETQPQRVTLGVGTSLDQFRIEGDAAAFECGIVQIAVSKFTSPHVASMNSDLRTRVSSMNLTAKRSVDMVAVWSSALKNV